MSQRRLDFHTLLYTAKKPENRKLKVCSTEAVSGALKVGLAAWIGGTALGPTGFVIGGLLGGLFASDTSQTLNPIPEVLEQMSEQEKKELIVMVQTVSHEHIQGSVMGILVEA